MRMDEFDHPDDREQPRYMRPSLKEFDIGFTTIKGLVKIAGRR